MCLKTICSRNVWSEGIEKVMECCEKVVIGHPTIEQKFQLLRVDVMRQQKELGLSDALSILFKCLNTFRENSDLYAKISRVISKYASPWVYQFLSKYNQQDRRLLIDIMFLLRMEPDTFCPKFHPEAVSNLASRLLLMLLQVPHDDHEVVEAVTRSIGLIWERHFDNEEWARKNLVAYFDIIIYGCKRSESFQPFDPDPKCLLPFAGLLNYIPVRFIPACAKEIISYYQNDGSITKLLDRFYIFLQWHTDNDLFAKDLVWPWMLNLFGALVAKRQTVLIVYFANQRIGDLIDLLVTVKISEGVMTIIEFLVYTYQHHHQVLQKVFTRLPRICRYYATAMKSNDSETLICRRICKRLSELGHVSTHMIKMKQWPITIPVELNEMMSNFPALSQDEIDKKILIHKWKTIANLNKENHNRTSLNSVIQEEVSHSTPSIIKRSETGYVGLRNLVNTCYANATIQMLFTCETFRLGVLTLDSSDNHLIRTVQVLFRMLESNDLAVSNPRSFLEVSRPGHFYPHMQQDASEYLTFVLDKLEESDGQVNLVSSSTSENSNLDSTGSNSVAKCENIQENSNRRSNPVAQLVRDMFEGTYEYTSVCSNCGNHHHTSEVFKLLSLPLQDQKPIDKLLESFFYDETELHDWKCDACETMGSGTQNIVITKLPKYLLLCLKIFSYDRETSQSKKIIGDVNIVPRLSIGESYVYSFFGTVLHHGTSLHCGHYTYFWRKDERFIHFNDTEVLFSSVEAISAPETTPYILVYKRT